MSWLAIRINCPAHIHPECYWLDLNEMIDFEELYVSWLEEVRSDSAASAESPDAASRLTRFILDQRERVLAQRKREAVG